VEQALVLKTVKGLIIILGCAHPGVVEMTTAIKEHFNEKIYCVLGGYHLGSKKESEIKDIILRFKKLGVYRVAPTHCTGQKAVEMFQKHYQDKFLPLKTGLEVELDF
jgi:7,8-dihydropterin-6-yl-methyl-4-(beta-D-ribofuranosyl)aminobenzene 5'-phosphate synthase